MSKLHLTHVQSVIKRLFDGKIDLSDIDQIKMMKAVQNEQTFLSRGLAAYALFILAGADEEIASKSITDGFDDNGIDAIYFDRNAKLLWIVQSKWIQSGTGSPELGEVKKFRDGIRDLIELDFRKFNSKIREPKRVAEIEDALNDHEVKLRIVVAFTGDKLSDHSQRDLNDLVQELNDPTELTQLQSFNLAEAHKTLTSSTSGQPINLDINLANWGQIEQPINAIYGTVNAADIADWWLTYHRRLFNENIRSFIGANDVNNSIQETLKQEPDYFWYFNNGITLLCKKISKAAVGGSDKSIGLFHCEGVSVVNGAQTVGNIGEVSKLGNNITNSRILVRLISLEDAPEKFGQRITKATNTQNRIEKRDFVTQDSQQERLALELKLLDKPIKYHYIRSDEIISVDDSNCSLEEATISLACANQDVDLAVLAKRELGKLWEDIEDKTKPYSKVFNDTISGIQLWRSVRVMREVSSYLKSFEDKNTGRKRSLYIHANRFLLHMMFCKLPNILDGSDLEFQKRIKSIPRILDKLVNKTWLIVERYYPTSLIHQIFRNYTKSRDIKNKIIIRTRNNAPRSGNVGPQ